MLLVLVQVPVLVLVLALALVLVLVRPLPLQRAHEHGRRRRTRLQRETSPPHSVLLFRPLAVCTTKGRIALHMAAQAAQEAGWAHAQHGHTLRPSSCWRRGDVGR